MNSVSFMKHRSAAPVVISVLLFAAVLACFVPALMNADSVSTEQQREAVKESVENAVTLCYSIEGEYPVSVDYLREYYGVVYNTDRYIVHYERFAANIRPTVAVLEKPN